MKFLHTSDWHLGQKFLHFDREEEHEMALDWLRETIVNEEVEALIVSGDIFDIGNPPNYARRLYYRFLTNLLNTSCRHVVITGGNHDSPAMLNAPRDLLAALNVYVVGAYTGDIADEIIELRNREGTLEAVVAAVPFLRDRDLKFSITGEGGMERIERIRTGIRHHYEEVAALIKVRNYEVVPILATGHLYAMGATASADQSNIYIGDLENIKAEEFPEIFHYVALGHLHRPQTVGGKDHIRYSGSLIPLSFSEVKDDKSVYLLDFDGEVLKEIQAISVPTFRRLKSIEGKLQKVEDSLLRFADKKDRLLTPWVEVTVESDQIIPQLDRYLQDLVADKEIELLKIRLKRQHQPLQQQVKELDLNQLEVLEVFRKKCESMGNPPEEMEGLVQTFKELQNWISEQDSE